MDKSRGAQPLADTVTAIVRKRMERLESCLSVTYATSHTSVNGLKRKRVVFVKWSKITYLSQTRTKKQKSVLKDNALLTRFDGEISKYIENVGFSKVEESRSTVGSLSAS